MLFHKKKAPQGADGMRCPSCNSLVLAGDAFCQVCGAELLQMEASVPSSSNVGGACPNCHQPIMAGDAFCQACGQPIANVAGSTDIPTTSRVCEACGSPMADSERFCWTCGWDSHPEEGYSDKRHGDLTGLVMSAPCPDSGVDEYPVPPIEQCSISGMKESHESRGNVVENGGPYRGSIIGKEVEANVASRLVVLTREEARSGCVKDVELEPGDKSTTIRVHIPANVQVDTKVDVLGLGAPSGAAGERGPLRLSFYIID